MEGVTVKVYQFTLSPERLDDLLEILQEAQVTFYLDSENATEDIEVETYLRLVANCELLSAELNRNKIERSG
jgi:hypothetical protein